MDKIVVLDFGGQYAHLIANRIRRLGVFSEIMDSDVSPAQLADAKGIILSGGPASVYENNAPTLNKEILLLGKPILGICYGHQLLVQLLGGDVKPGKTREFGAATLTTEPNPLFEGLSTEENVWMSHGDTVQQLPKGFNVVGKTADCAFAAVYHPQQNIYGIQFHPEVTHTPNGMKMLENFVNVCKCKRDWSMKNYVEQKMGEIRAQIGTRKVFLLASGGVDSTVCLILLNKALGTQNVKALHIDNGFMREQESQHVMSALRRMGFDNFTIEDASAYFLEKTNGLIDPEEKRKAIGQAFVDVQQNVLQKMGLNSDEWVLGQGTIYPDAIESGKTKHAQVIKTHHNRVEIIQKMIAEGKVIEPIDQLYKDEVRELGTQLGLPLDVVQRHPFPGPGLAIRVLCSDGKEPPISPDIQARVQTIANEKGLNAIILPLKSVGVQGDNRTYKHPVVLEGNADWATLDAASTRLTNEEREVNRVVWKLAGTIVPKTQPATLTRERLEVLRKADSIVEKHLRENGLYDTVWQFPVILAPLDIKGKEAIILRPVYSTEAMTARFADLPMDVVKGMSEEIMKVNGVGVVLYDLTHKPPGTIEWE